MSTVRVAAGQAGSVPGDLAANLATAVDLLEEAAQAGAELLVLPEAFLTGYDEGVFARGDFAAPGELGAVLAPLVRAVAAGRTNLLLAHPLARPGGSTLAMLLMRPGETGSEDDCAPAVEAGYDKQHPDADERAWFVPGRPSPPRGPGPVLEAAGLRVAPAICSDVGAEEHAAAAARARADVYAVSAAWFPGSETRRDTTLAARASRHRLPLVHAGAVGPSAGRRGARTMVGGSCVLDADGEVLARLGTEEGVAVADLVRGAHPGHRPA